MRLISAILVISTALNLKAQVTYEKLKYAYSSLLYIDSIRNTKTPSVVFLCPHNNKKNYYSDDSLYDLKLDILLRKLKYENIDAISVFSIPMDYTPLKDFFLRSKSGKDSIAVDHYYFECFALNFNEKFLDRASKKFKSSFYITRPFKDDQTFVRINIIDSAQCFKDLPSRIPGYADFFVEAIRPKFEISERIIQILEKLEKLEISMEGIRNDLSKLDSLVPKTVSRVK
jgi:hypothetical protein